MPTRLPIAVLVSGSGSNLQAILDASASDAFAAEVCVVISDRPAVRALERAVEAGVPAEVVAWAEHGDRDLFTAAVCRVAERHGAAALVLAGFMRILGTEAIGRFPTGILNIHPSLLPAFPGTMHAVRDALAHGVKITGVTVHYVTAEVDGGPIIAQEAVPVLPDDDEASLHARVQQVEHRLYPDVVDALARGALMIDGRRVTWKEHS
ncbi:MAG TPA: phosphoribosylglycinamide formyltransferase [Acidimicrobiia bacterium]|jgi:phosphoribosylglycinamide formyltransferase-1|nr:phosphoribosylglycinamide formyltransferase [Acidimicrobiia bacterium]